MRHDAFIYPPLSIVPTEHLTPLLLQLAHFEFPTITAVTAHELFESFFVRRPFFLLQADLFECLAIAAQILLPPYLLETFLIHIPMGWL